MAQPGRSKRRAQWAAREVLDRFGTDVPVDAATIAVAHGIEVRFQELEDEVSGMLLVRDDCTVIGINAHHHPNRQRFSIAHELGHFLLHREEERFFIDAAVFFRSEGATPATWKQEREANAFAAELLLPRDAVTAAVRSTPFDPHDEAAVRRMADRVGVSAQALTIRLAELDLIDPLAVQE